MVEQECNMEKYIKLDGERIVEVRPLLKATEPIDPTLPPNEIEYQVNPELLERFEKEFTRANVPDGVPDIELLTGYLYKNNKFVKTTIFKEQVKLRIELDEIRNWLAQNDWIPNKIIVGEWETTDPRWLDYLKERAIKRARQDEIIGGSK